MTADMIDGCCMWMMKMGDMKDDIDDDYGDNDDENIHLQC